MILFYYKNHKHMNVITNYLLPGYVMTLHCISNAF